MDLVTPERFDSLLDIVVPAIINDTDFIPDTILALSTGGFPVAAALAKRLDIPSHAVVGLPIYKDQDGHYHLDDTLVSLVSCEGRQVLVVDDSSNRGLRLRKAVGVVEERGGVAKSCALIAWETGLQPDFVAEISSGYVPKFYWERV